MSPDTALRRIHHSCDFSQQQKTILQTEIDAKETEFQPRGAGRNKRSLLFPSVILGKKPCRITTVEAHTANMCGHASRARSWVQDSQDVSFLSLTLVVEFCKVFMCEEMHRNSVLMLETIDKTITPRRSFICWLACSFTNQAHRTFLRSLLHPSQKGQLLTCHFSQLCPETSVHGFRRQASQGLRGRKELSLKHKVPTVLNECGGGY